MTSMYDVDTTTKSALIGRKNYVREALDAALSEKGLTLSERHTYVGRVLEKLDQHSFPLPPLFYDFDRAARIHARMEGIDITAAQKSILSNPDALLEVHDVQNAETLKLLDKPKQTRHKPGDTPMPQLEPRRKRGTAPKPLPDDNTLARCALNAKTKLGQLPTAANSTGDKGHIGGLPEDGPKWGNIIMRLREERGTTLGVIVRIFQLEQRRLELKGPQ